MLDIVLATCKAMFGSCYDFPGKVYVITGGGSVAGCLGMPKAPSTRESSGVAAPCSPDARFGQQPPRTSRYS